MINVGEFDLYVQEMNILGASQKFTSLYRNMPWESVSSEYSESSWWPREAWEQRDECFVQDGSHPIALGILTQKFVSIFQKKKKKTIIIAYVSTTESKIPQISCISSAVSKSHLIVVLQNSGSPVLIPSQWPVVGQLRSSLYIILTQGLGVHEPPSSCCTAAKAEKK